MNAISYATCSSACVVAFQWHHALRIFHAWAGRPTAALLTAALGAVQRWPEAFGALETATRRRLELDGILYNALLHVCERGHQWRKAWRSKLYRGKGLGRGRNGSRIYDFKAFFKVFGGDWTSRSG